MSPNQTPKLMSARAKVTAALQAAKLQQNVSDDQPDKLITKDKKKKSKVIAALLAATGSF